MNAETRIHKQSLLNNPAATADTTSMPGYTIFDGLNPIPTALIKEVIQNLRVVEVQQLITFTTPTIVASTRYSVHGGELQSTDKNKVGNKSDVYAATSQAVLSGTALTDKINVIYPIGWKIMQKAKAGDLHVTAGPTATFTNATTAYAGVIGDEIEGITSGAKAVVAVINSATEKIVIMTTSNDFTDTEAIKINGVVTTTTAATNVYTGNLGILDDAGYYPAKGNRKGPSSWQVGDNFASTALAVTRAGVVGRGIGTRLLDDVPVMETYSPNLNSGQFFFATNEAPTAGKTYTSFDIVYDVEHKQASHVNAVGKYENCQRLWLRDDATNYAALAIVINAL